MEPKHPDITRKLNDLVIKYPFIAQEVAKITLFLDDRVNPSRWGSFQHTTVLLSLAEQAKKIIMQLLNYDLPLKHQIVEVAQSFANSVHMMQHAHENSHFQNYTSEMHRNSSMMKINLLAQLKFETQRRKEVEKTFVDMQEALKKKQREIEKLNDQIKGLESIPGNKENGASGVKINTENKLNPKLLTLSKEPGDPYSTRSLKQPTSPQNSQHQLMKPKMVSKGVDATNDETDRKKNEEIMKLKKDNGGLKRQLDDINTRIIAKDAQIQSLTGEVDKLVGKFNKEHSILEALKEQNKDDGRKNQLKIWEQELQFQKQEMEQAKAQLEEQKDKIKDQLAKKDKMHAERLKLVTELLQKEADEKAKNLAISLQNRSVFSRVRSDFDPDEIQEDEDFNRKNTFGPSGGAPGLLKRTPSLKNMRSIVPVPINMSRKKQGNNSNADQLWRYMLLQAVTIEEYIREDGEKDRGSSYEVTY